MSVQRAVIPTTSSCRSHQMLDAYQLKDPIYVTISYICIYVAMLDADQLKGPMYVTISYICIYVAINPSTTITANQWKSGLTCRENIGIFLLSLFATHQPN